MKFQKVFSNNKAIWIEMLGLPASGKSTLVDKFLINNKAIVNINKLLPENHFFRQVYKAISLFIYFINSPKIFLNDILEILHSRQQSTRDLLAVTSNWFLIQCLVQKYNTASKNAIIFDQGLFQSIWSIMISSNSKINIYKLLYRKELPDIVYVLDEESDVLIKRINERKYLMRMNFYSKENFIKGTNALNLIIDNLFLLGYVRSETDI
jgi:broad-specificity NMP kinase